MVRLSPLTDAYASVRVAVYEPMIVKWLSVPVLTDLLVKVLDRHVEKRTGDVAGGTVAPTIARFDWRLLVPAASTTGEPPAPRRAAAPGPGKLGPAAPVLAQPSTRALDLSPEELKRRHGIIRALIVDPALDVDTLLKELGAADLPHLVERGGLSQGLSPIGLAHFYRQLYFDAGAGLGPIEHAFTVAPKEELVVVQEMTRRESVERTETLGTETTLEKSAEESTVEEISDHVQTSLRRDMAIGVSASAEGSVGVWGASAQASVDFAESSERSRELARTRSVSQTKKSSEILRKSHSLTVKSFSELTERSTIRRTIRNEGDAPVNYGLRRVLRTVRVKLQDLGPRMVWQLYVKRPGERLALSKLVMFRDADPVAPATFPNAPPKPVGGVEAGSQTTSVQGSGHNKFIEIVLPEDSSREFTAVTVDSITDADPDKDSTAPGIVEATVAGQEDETARVWRYTFKVTGSAQVVNVTYSIHFEPSREVLDEWRRQVLAAQKAWEVEQQEAAFERAKRIILAKSQIRPRPSADLRDEERYEIMNRMISEAFHDAPAKALPAPIEIELFHRYFEIATMFYYVHPAWWVPRYGAKRADYEITDESEPARFGKSLGWLVQLDGDRRRDEFLNSPWIRVCLPIRPGVERDAVQWLAQHIEGRRGFSTEPNTPLGKLLADIEGRREDERAALPGPDYVTLDGTIPPTREVSAEAYPVIDEFDIVVPTEGFIYDSIETG
jgi:hypothetical protein